jgi:hypothetical protein
MKTIFTVFAGRKKNIEILKKYLYLALEAKIIDEVHFWNNTRNKNDEEYLKTISNLRRTSSSNDGNYNEIFTPIINNNFSVTFSATNDAHIKISDANKKTYEIVLGGWGNTRSVIRENNIELANSNKNIKNINQMTVNISIINNQLLIKDNNETLISTQIIDGFDIQNIYIKTGFQSIGNFYYDTVKNHNFYFMDTCQKSWKNYYNYYNNSSFTNDIILKSDDDIVFIDLLKLPKFLEFVKNNDYDLVYANTINNGVAAYYQQNKYNLIPKNLMDLEYPDNGLSGSLWESGQKAEKLHNYFIDNSEKFLNLDYNQSSIEIKTRYSINFFAYKGKNWHKISNAYTDDEYNLTVKYVSEKKFKNVLYFDFYVAHLSFFKQVETGINLDNLIDKYSKFYEKIKTTFVFPSI